MLSLRKLVGSPPPAPQMGEGGHGVAREGARQNDGDGGESGEADASGAATRAPLAKDHLRPASWRKMLTPRQWAALTAVLVVVLWTGGSIAFAFLYDYKPFDSFDIPGDVVALPSVCALNQTCLWAIGGSVAAHDAFLPTVEAFNGTHWGSEERLPATCPNHVKGRPDEDCGDAGEYGVGVTSHAVAFKNRIYLIGHNRFGAGYSYSGNLEVVRNKLGKKVKDTYWPEAPELNYRREGFAVTTYRGRIYAIGGKTTCTVQSKLENPDSRCVKDGHLTRTDQATQDRSTTVETIDPENELEWRVDCEGGGEEEGGVGSSALCTQQERSGACAAVHDDKIFLIGGNDGSVMEFFDGEKWVNVEKPFPKVILGASAISFGGKLWILGGITFNRYQDSVISWDGSIWFKGARLTYARAYHRVVEWEVCRDVNEVEVQGLVLADGLAPPTKSRCQPALYVLGGKNGSTSINEVEVATFGIPEWEILPTPMPTMRDRLGVAVFAKAPPPEAESARRSRGLGIFNNKQTR